MTYSVPQNMSSQGVPEVAQEPLHDHEFGVYCRPDCPRWGNPVPQPGWEQPQDWYFTFGANHLHPVTGESLGRRYVVINGTCDGTREAMFEVFGRAWSHQYATILAAGVERYGLLHLPLPVVPQAVADQHGDPDTLVDELREEYAQVEADQDRTPTDAGFIEFLARRIARADAVRAKVRAKALEEPSGGAAALRADVVTSVVEEVEALRRQVVEFGDSWEHRYGAETALARLDRIAALVRGEQQ